MTTPDTPDEWADYLDPALPDPDLDPLDRELLDRARRTLAEGETWDGPSAGLEERILREAAETPQDRPEPSSAPTAPAARPGSAAERARRRWARPLAIAAAAVAVAAAAAVGLVLVRQPVDDAPVAGKEFTVTGTTLAADATGTADIVVKRAGDAVTLHLKGLPPAPPGTYYAAWVTGPRGTVPIGSFHWHKGGIPIELWSGVDTTAYPRLSVTLQREGAPPVRSDRVFLRATLR